MPGNDDGYDGEGNANGKLSIKIMLPNKACRATIVSGHLCRAFFSVKKTDHVNYNDHESSAHIHDELKLCLQTFSELLSEASLNWENALVSSLHSRIGFSLLACGVVAINFWTQLLCSEGSDLSFSASSKS